MVGGQSSRAVMRAGRHDVETELRIWVIADGVKGELRARREIFVVWALRMMAALEKRARGFSGRLVMLFGGLATGVLRVASKLSRRALMEPIQTRRAARCSLALVLFILQGGLLLFAT